MDFYFRATVSAPSLQRRLETHQITILGRNAKTSISELSVSGTTPKTQESKDIEVLPSQDHEHAARTRTISTSKDLTAASGASLSYGGYQSTDIESRDDGASYVSEYEGMVKSLSMNPLQAVENESVEVESSVNSHYVLYKAKTLFILTLAPNYVNIFEK